MKLVISQIISIFYFLTCASSFSQEEKILGYKIEGDDIVFVFDISNYNRITSDDVGSINDFDDLNIKEVIVSGQFNDWTRDKWKMTKNWY